MPDPPHERPGRLDQRDRVQRAFQGAAPRGAHRLAEPGRVSPDGRYGSVTTFVTSDSYAIVGSYSTRTDIIDMRSGTVLFDLDQLAVSRGGKPLRAMDFIKGDLRLVARR